MNVKAPVSKFSHSPLQEVIFEMLLHQEIDADGNATAESFDLAQKIFDKRIAKEFQHRIALSSPSEGNTFPRIKYQYWMAQDQWPVVQTGPGILTVNDTAGSYQWDAFYALILQTLKRFGESYPKALDIKRLTLRYIDAVVLEDIDAEEKVKFVNANFKVNVRNDFLIKDATLLSLNVDQTYQLKDKSLLNFFLSDGKRKDDKPAIIWQIQVIQTNVKTLQEVAGWLKSAHAIASGLFKNSLTSEFYEQFT